MAFSQDNIQEHLGNNLADLEGMVSAAVMGKLRTFDTHTTAEFFLPVIDYFVLAHNLGNKSHVDLAREAGIGKTTVRTIFQLYGLPIVDRKTAAKRKWDDPGYMGRQRENGIAVMHRLKQDPDFLVKEAAAKSAFFREQWANNPAFAQAVAERARQQCNERWQDPEFRQRQHDGLKKELERRWKDPEFRRRFAETHEESTRQLWADDGFRQKISAASREARYAPEGLHTKMHIPSIHGYRRDIGFYAQSMMEANLARVFMLNHANLSRRQTFQLLVPEEFRSVIGQERAEITVDFAIKDRRGRSTLYEIMAHPLEAPVGTAKLALLRQQYPQYTVVAVGQQHYEALGKEFAGRINLSQSLCGWETRQDNLRNNPAKYA